MSGVKSRVNNHVNNQKYRLFLYKKVYIVTLT